MQLRLERSCKSVRRKAWGVGQDVRRDEGANYETGEVVKIVGTSADSYTYKVKWIDGDVESFDWDEIDEMVTYQRNTVNMINRKNKEWEDMLLLGVDKDKNKEQGIPEDESVTIERDFSPEHIGGKVKLAHEAYRDFSAYLVSPSTESSASSHLSMSESRTSFDVSSICFSETPKKSSNDSSKKASIGSLCNLFDELEIESWRCALCGGNEYASKDGKEVICASTYCTLNEFLF